MRKGEEGAAAVMIYLPHAVPKRNAAQRNEAIKNVDVVTHKRK